MSARRPTLTEKAREAGIGEAQLRRIIKRCIKERVLGGTPTGGTSDRPGETLLTAQSASPPKFEMAAKRIRTSSTLR